MRMWRWIGALATAAAFAAVPAAANAETLFEHIDEIAARVVVLAGLHGGGIRPVRLARGRRLHRPGR